MGGGRGINNLISEQLIIKIGNKVCRGGVMECWGDGVCERIRIGDIKNSEFGTMQLITTSKHAILSVKRRGIPKVG
jgi:hypothetical protein